MKPPIVFVILQTGAQANGGLQSVGELMRRLKDHRPIVLTNLESEIARSWRESGIEVHVVPEEASTGVRRGLGRTFQTYRRYHGALRDILKASGARLVHANDPLAFQLSLSAAKTSGARLLLNLRDTIDPDRRPPRAKFRALFAAADHVFYLSNEMAERWHLVAPNAKRTCSVTYSIVDPRRFAPRAPSQGPGRVLVPGIFWPKKGQLEFIQKVVPALAERGIETWFAGDFEPNSNPYAAACARAAEGLADSVRFLGYRSDLPELYGQAAVIAVPSRHEGLMRGMIEAMSCERAVVSFDVCSAREVLEHESGAAGAVATMGDYDGMAAALIRLATDRDARLAAGKAGGRLARSLFDPETVVECYESVYRRLNVGT